MHGLFVKVLPLQTFVPYGIILFLTVTDLKVITYVNTQTAANQSLVYIRIYVASMLMYYTYMDV